MSIKGREIGYRLFNFRDSLYMIEIFESIEICRVIWVDLRIEGKFDLLKLKFLCFKV